MTSHSLYETIEIYCSFLKSQRGLSEKTIKGYRHDLMNLSRYMVQHLKKDSIFLTDLDQKTISGYLIYLQDKHDYKNTSLARKVSSIKNFLLFCEEHEYLESSPRRFIKSPKLPRKLPFYLTDDEMRRLFRAPDTSQFTGIRDYTILVTLGMTGMRLSELVQLNVEDIDFQHFTIRVLGKGSKERLIPMNKFLYTVFQNYLQKRIYTQSSAVFINKHGTRISGRFIEIMIKQYAARAGLSWRKVTPHKLRHTFATLLHQHNIDLLEIQKLLGHSSISSTQIYTHTNITRLKNAVDKLDNF